MGGCASKPKDLDTKEAPAAPEEPQQAQEINKDGDETKKEEPLLVDVSEPAAPESDQKTEEKPAAEAVEEDPPKQEPESDDSAPVVKE
ncbi:putative serine/threonine-protein kinase kinX-like [Dorcoceras hygrometricum]|uniref:Putative serine/threonine-protein kinase kinX-like n=1 Tax=Dorcoceras hygrometricum TaxID=472368 RepID=A0A2Z7CBX8_9LAMI|nr:putative serine/threonine-protein kinase kinX-like [Dorcoceras hygrometricum]